MSEVSSVSETPLGAFGIEDVPNVAHAGPSAVDFPMPFNRFASTLKGTADEIWTKLLDLEYGREKHTTREWLRLTNYVKARRI